MHICGDCSKTYRQRQLLYRHKKSCRSDSKVPVSSAQERKKSKQIQNLFRIIDRAGPDSNSKAQLESKSEFVPLETPLGFHSINTGSNADDADDSSKDEIDRDESEDEMSDSEPVCRIEDDIINFDI